MGRGEVGWGEVDELSLIPTDPSTYSPLLAHPYSLARGTLTYSLTGSVSLISTRKAATHNPKISSSCETAMRNMRQREAQFAIRKYSRQTLRPFIWRAQ